MVKMSNLSNGDCIETKVYNLTVKPESQPKVVKLRTFENAVNNLGHIFLTNLTNLALLQHRKHIDQLQIYSKYEIAATK